MKKKLWLLIIILMAVVSWGYRYQTREVHIHAGFLVYVDGIKQDFSDPKYMKLEMCGVETKKDEQLEKAHLHDGVGEVVHVHRRGAKWGDLFKNIGYQLPEGEVSAYVNGVRVNNIMHTIIKPYDSLVLAVGRSNSINVEERVSVARIKEVEEMVEKCGS